MAEVKMALNENTLQVTTATEAGAAPKTGLEFKRHYTDGKISPFDAVEWEQRTALIGNEKGQVIFRQENVEVPKAWSQTATNIVASKYFHGKPNTPAREGSVRQLIARVVDTIVGWGEKTNYFDSPASRDQACRAVRNAVQNCARHPAVFAYSVVNELPPDIVRWSGARAVEEFLDDLVADTEAGGADGVS